ncbi:MAG: nickel transporter [Calditrichaeota bacterium]|nr:MAG: nickel transporter [Calditrichota bacterium]
MFWGIGHSLGVWGIGLLAFLFREFIPVELLSAWSERLVGVVLIAIGIWGLRRAYTQRLHIHVHRHDDLEHAHFHLHGASDQHSHDNASHEHSHAPLGVGVLHGLAGSSHLLGVLPALMLPTRLASFLYVVSFGIGSIIGMTFFAWVVNKFSLKLIEKHAYSYTYLMYGFSALAMAVGGFWIFQSF